MTEYTPPKTGEYLSDITQISDPMYNEKNFKDNKRNSLHLTQKKKTLGYLASAIISFSKLTVFLKLHSQKTVSFLEKIMSVNKYLKWRLMFIYCS